MTMFLISFFSLYSLLHFYVFMKARNAFALGVRASLVLVLFMLWMIAAPVIIRQFEKYDIEPLARIMAYVGYTWLGFLFLLVCGLIVIDLYRIVLYLAGLLLPAGSVAEGLRAVLSSRSYFLIALSVSLLISIYGGFEASRIGVDTIRIHTSKLPAAVSPLRIVQISDVHIGLIVRDSRVQKIMGQVKRAKPDLFLSTGDLVDGDTATLGRLAEMLREVHPRYGKFAITGNHEYYAGIEQAVAFTKEAGFTMLRGERANVGEFLTIVGLDDPAGPGMIKGDGDLEGKLLALPSGGRFILLLKHRPDVEQASLGRFDLQLSGHLHKGQIFPFRFFVRLFYPMYTGLYALDRNSSLYVSAGSGTWGPPIRFLAPPKVTLIELVHAE
ncbi:MAG TPA: metallophosphoesterase [Syntrophorhabdales bacterium]|nr:metallophosphoesterase [Syntrophorhabdales bacterium]